MKKFLIIAAIVAVPPLGAILALKQINDGEKKLNKKNAEIDVLLKEKNSPWSEEQIAGYKQRVRKAN